MKSIRRAISFLLSVVMVLGMFPVSAFSVETNANMDTGEVIVEGSNAFGELMAEKIEAVYTDEEVFGAYSVTDLTIAGNTAVIEYSAMEEAVLVVALYSEDGLQLLTSGKTTVSPGATEATVTISNMPEYFMAEAFLVDTYDYSPLCQSYETPIYTKAMQELLASTVEDYDPEKVLNLDSDNSTNFAVYGEDTVLVEEQSGVNTIISADDENLTYVIGNADDTFLYLQPGDVVSYDMGAEAYLFIKVAEVTVEDTTVTIQGAELELEDVFSHVKIEETGNSDDAEYDTSSADAGVTYLGTSGGYARTDSAGKMETAFLAHEISISIPPIGPARANLALSFSINADLEYYSVKSMQSIELRIDQNYAFKTGGAITLEKDVDLALGFMKIPLGVGTLNLGPRFFIEASASFYIEQTGTVKHVYTVVHEDEVGWSYKPLISVQTSNDMFVEGRLCYGFALGPKFESVGKLLEVEIATKLYMEATAKKSLMPSDDPQVKHTCENCYDGACYFDHDSGVSVSWLNKLSKWDFNVVEQKIKLEDFYYCKEHEGGYAEGDCPYYAYMVTLMTKDADGNFIPNVLVNMDGEYLCTTDEHGFAFPFILPGKYMLSAEYNGKMNSSELDIKAPCTATLVLPVEEKPDDGEAGEGGADPSEPAEPEETFPGVFGTVESVTVAKPLKYHSSYQWSDTIICTYYADDSSSNGLVVFEGTGVLNAAVPGSEVSNVPNWATEIRIEDGITGIGDEAFRSTYGLEKVTLAETVTSIGAYAFESCHNLKTVKIRGALDSVGDYAFGWNDNLNNVYLGDGTTTIGNYMFYECPELTTARIPDGVEQIGTSAFYGCKRLKNVRLPDHLTELGELAFGSCESITSIIIPQGLKEIKDLAFHNCTGLRYLSIPYGVTVIGDSAFYKCTSLTEVNLPDSLTMIGDSVFSYCTNLRKITLPEGMTNISEAMFSGCDALKDLDFIEDISDIGAQAFANCNGLVDIEIPEGVTQIGINAFGGCENLRSVKIPDGITVIPDNMFTQCPNLVNVEIPDSVCKIGNVAFYNCTSLREIRIPDSVNNIGAIAFLGCTSLEKVVLPAKLGYLNGGVFEGCSSLKEIEIPETVSMILNTAFKDTALEHVELPSGVELGAEAFMTDTLKKVWFRGDMPICAEAAFGSDDCVGFYPVDNKTWTYDNLKDQPGLNLSQWHPYTVDNNGERVVNWEETLPGLEVEEMEKVPSAGLMIPTENIVPEATVPEETVPEEIIPETTLPEETVPETTVSEETIPEITVPEETIPETGDAAEVGKDITLFRALLDSFAVSASAAETDAIAPRGIFGGEYGAEDTELYTLRTATFYDLVPGAQYLLLDMISISGADPLAAMNLLSIDQGTADSSGTLVFEYVQRQDYGASYIVACGPSNQNLNEAFITLPDMEFDGEKKVVEPTVDYYGSLLKEGQDYVVLGQVSATDIGNYICYIRGIHNYTGLVKCTWSISSDIENRIIMDAVDLNGQSALWIDGVEYVVQMDGERCYVDLPDGNARTMVSYTYHSDDYSDVHSQYPVSMKVWTLSNTNGIYTATRVEELDDILQYSGSSIRVTGRQGIRMITSIDQAKKTALISDGLAGYTLKEYGTVVAWENQMGGKPLILGKTYAKSNYAYKKGVADPVFAYDGDLMQYTNVLVGFSNAQCGNDLAMRPYMILADAEDNEITLYGGIVMRSIGYIAYQNRNYFEPGTDAYEYVWNMIHSIYGDIYDAEYQK